ncbi:MAG: peptidoglycan-binding protein [Cellulomonadaceae bacterium]|nr:peptidoglycan-binding protein [Cellulomonadaceae bacterium]
MATLAPALTTLRTQINTAWPSRDKTSDGWIGDARHSALVSDHNPDARGIVHAIDVDVDGVDKAAVIAAAVADKRTSYIISDRRIWTPAAGWKPYSGANPHTAHIHISVTVAGENNTAAWNLRSGATGTANTVAPDPAPPAKPVTSTPAMESHMKTIDLRNAHVTPVKGQHVKILQGLLAAWGHYSGKLDAVGAGATKSALSTFQKAHNLTPDAVAGANTNRTLIGG